MQTLIAGRKSRERERVLERESEREIVRAKERESERERDCTVFASCLGFLEYRNTVNQCFRSQTYCAHQLLYG